MVLLAVGWGFMMGMGRALGAEDPLVDEGFRRDADRILEKLRDTTLLPLLHELRVSQVKIVEEGDVKAHWFFGLDTVFWVDGRHDAVSWNTGSRSRSVEPDVGLNHGAFATMRQGKLYTLGGSGLYKEHANLFVFNVLKGWNLLKARGLEPASVHAHQVVMVSEDQWWVLGNERPQEDEEGLDISRNTVWSLDLANLLWSKAGVMDADLAAVLGHFEVISAGEYAAIFGTTSGGVLNVLSGDFVELPGFTLGQIPPHDAYAVREHNVFWLVRGDAGAWSQQQLDLKAMHQGGSPRALIVAEMEASPDFNWFIGVLAVAALFLVGAAGTWAWLQRRRRNVVSVLQPAQAIVERSRSVPDAPVEASVLDADYELVLGMLDQPDRLMNAQKLNELLGIGPDVSEDSQRSRRARAIRRMNDAFMARHGVLFITRERDSQDRRHLLYKLEDIPEA